MKTFLEKLAEEINTKYSDIPGKICIVFPSRRAGIYFKNELAKLQLKPIWSPAVFSIQDFIAELSTIKSADRITLLFELYEAFGKTETFDDFFPWGEMILRDFDSIDKYLVNPETLFKNIKDIKDIEAEFPLEFQDEFKKFWESILNTKPSDLKNDFVKIWEILPDVYKNFRERLIKQKIGYEGMLYQNVFENLHSGKLKIKWNKIIFAGFNSFNKCESNIINILLNNKIAELYWDADEYYLKDPKQEAGEFLRKNFKLFNISKPEWVSKELSESRKIFSISGTPLNTGQAKAFGSELKELLVQKQIDIGKTAVVLPKEDLLLPVLFSLPEEINEINVTMGFPFKGTPLYNLISLIKSLQANCKGKKGNETFYHKDVFAILSHPYIKYFNTGFVYELENEIRKYNIIFLKKEKIIKSQKNDNPITELIFRKTDTIPEIFEYFKNILDYLADNINPDESTFEKFQAEFIYHFYSSLNRLEDIINKYSASISTDIFWKLLTDILRTSVIPFTGEPLKGLQIMGLLETRAIDFENVFILSMNEGVIPTGNSHNSFIPYPLRKAFGLPVFQDNDSMTAYNFYRLIQRAKRVHLFYNSEPDENIKEMSRFVYQIENELIQANNKIEYKHNLVSAKVNFTSKKEIRIKKDIKQLDNIERFSQSILSDYIQCKLNFYLKHIAKLPEEKEAEEIISPMSFGKILHRIMERLYKPFINKTISENEIESIKKGLNENYDTLFSEALVEAGFKERNNFSGQGRNAILKHTIKRFAEMILEQDKQIVPFKISGLEEEVFKDIQLNSGMKIKMKGYIDRLQEKNGILEIVDYKTGSDEVRKYTERSKDYFEKTFTNPKYKTDFQLFTYIYLLSKERNVNNINAGIYARKSINSGISYSIDGTVDLKILDEYERCLMELLEEIYNKDIHYTQTEDKNRCIYCTYKGICYRE